MNKPELMRQIEEAVDDLIGTTGYGTVEVTIKAGEPAMLRQEKHTKLNYGGNEQNRHATKNCR
jgi:hypothetical protein